MLLMNIQILARATINPVRSPSQGLGALRSRTCSVWLGSKLGKAFHAGEESTSQIRTMLDWVPTPLLKCQNVPLKELPSYKLYYHIFPVSTIKGSLLKLLSSCHC